MFLSYLEHYIDGHVRAYHGKQTKLPKRYVSRERYCLRGVTDYWINDAIGQPFFPNGEKTVMQIAEREVKHKCKQNFREIRKLSKSGHQTVIM